MSVQVTTKVGIAGKVKVSKVLDQDEQRSTAVLVAELDAIDLTLARKTHLPAGLMVRRFDIVELLKAASQRVRSIASRK